MKATAGRRVVILGATSSIAEATARLYAREGAMLLLAGRDADRLGSLCADMIGAGAASAQARVVDLLGADAPAELAEMDSLLGGIDDILLAFGAASDQHEAEQSVDRAAQVVAVNFSGPMRWVLAAANLFEARGHGSLVVIGSVSGDRGRRRNYVYGSAKAGLAVLVEGVAHRLALKFQGRGPRAVLVKAGPVGVRSAAGRPFGTTPQKVAAVIRRAADRGGPIQYVPARWRIIMRLVREIPVAIFHRLDF